MAERREPDSEGWHLDKRVPIAMIVAILMQFMGFIWWAASTDANLSDHRRRIDRLETGGAETGRGLVMLAERFARIEERVTAQLDILRRIEADLVRERERRE